jgi:hypothetical protein
MYNKLYGRIIRSSIWLAPDAQRIAWITLISVMDQDGFVDMACPANLAHMARISLEDAIASIEAFTSPDPADPSQEHEGRRIERVPGGYVVLNAHKYNDLATAEQIRKGNRDRAQLYRERHKKPVTVTKHPLLLPNSNAPVTPSVSGPVPVPGPEPSEALQTGLSKTLPSQAPAAPAGPKASSVPRGTRIPPDFALTPKRAAFALGEGLAPERTFDAFCDYWNAKPGQAGTKLDWDRTWQTWCRTQADRIPGVRRPGARAPTTAELEARHAHE